VLRVRVQLILDGELEDVLAVDVESLRSEVRSVLIDVSAEAGVGTPPTVRRPVTCTRRLTWPAATSVPAP